MGTRNRILQRIARSIEYKMPGTGSMGFWFRLELRGSRTRTAHCINWNLNRVFGMPVAPVVVRIHNAILVFNIL